MWAVTSLFSLLPTITNNPYRFWILADRSWYRQIQQNRTKKVTTQLCKVVEYQLYCTRSILRNARFSSKYSKSTSLLLLIIKHLGTFRYLSSYTKKQCNFFIRCTLISYFAELQRTSFSFVLQIYLQCNLFAS